MISRRDLLVGVGGAAAGGALPWRKVIEERNVKTE
jgi:hypothetical protein